jgi:hypothetical protein
VETESRVVEVTACFAFSLTVSAERAAEVYDELELQLSRFMSASLEGARVTVSNPPKNFIDALLRTHPSGPSPRVSSFSIVYGDHHTP